MFLGENRWFAIRISGIMRPQIKYIAAYQVSPMQAITYVAPVKSIEPYQNTAKAVVNFSEPASAIGPIKLVPQAQGGRVAAPQAPRYTTRSQRLKAKTLDDVWEGTQVASPDKNLEQA